MRRGTVLLGLLAGTICVFGIPRRAAADTCDYDKMFGREDKTIFGRDCALCHSISGNWDKPGPVLGGLFDRKQMRTGDPITEETVRKRIAEGAPGMPGFRYTLTPAQINDLIHYLKTVSCPADPAMQKLVREKRNAPLPAAPPPSAQPMPATRGKDSVD